LAGLLSYGGVVAGGGGRFGYSVTLVCLGLCFLVVLLDFMVFRFCFLLFWLLFDTPAAGRGPPGFPPRQRRCA